MAGGIAAWALLLLGAGPPAGQDAAPAPQDEPAAAASAEGEPAGPASPEALSPADRERLWHYRNLGKAFYENPTTQYEAVDEFARALALVPGSARERLNYGLALLRAGKVAEGVAEIEKVQARDPDLPHTWFNLGIAYKRDARYADAIAQFERMVALVPDEPISHFNLGTLYKLEGDPERALVHFEKAAEHGPSLAGPRFQLYNAYKAAGRADDAARELARFREIKAGQEGAAVPEDLEWSWYAEIYDPVEPPPDPSGAPEPAWRTREVARGLDAATAGLAALVARAPGEGIPAADLVAWSKAGIALYAGGEAALAPVEGSGLAGLPGVVAAAPGDFDDDGLADLAVITAEGPALYRNAGGRFERFAAALPAGSYRAVAWLDYDHDYDLDLFLLGKAPALVRNPGGGAAEGWTERTADFPFADGEAIAAVTLHAVPDTQGYDLAVAHAGRPGVLYRDELGGRFEAEPLEAVPAGEARLAAGDFDGDGWIDLAAGGTLLLNRDGKAWEPRPSPAPVPFALVDPGNAGFPRPVAPPGEPPAAALAAGDFDGDGRADLAAVGADGVLRLHADATAAGPEGGRALAVRLTGVKNRKVPTGAAVEVKSGSLYQKQTYRGVPLVFGLGGRAEVDTVRVTWPNGLVQNEARQKPGALAVEEAPRLSGSCPMIFAWNGERFEFVTDVLGVAPLGASAGNGQYFPVDHDEVIQIPPGTLVERDGAYELRITEELREVAFLDLVRLVAVDRPAGIEVFVNDQFRAPPFPEHRLHATARRIPPVAARDERGRDVLDRVAARDRRYPDGFERDSAGVASRHRLDLDFGAPLPAGTRTLLILNGWVDWADGSTFLAAAQRPGGGLEMPRLSVKDASGAWVTAIAEMGIPAGKPKTIVVDLTGAWRSGSREVRIESNLCVYWDEVFLAVESPEAPLVRTALAPAVAELRFRGFSRPVIHPQRKQPESFDYQSWMPVTMWNPTPGLYTRYGDVRPLLGAVDDRFVIMGSGDEVRLLFDAAALPPLPAGWARDFQVEVDGWAKDGDANTAHSQTVEPLPFHGMSQYPYPEGEAFPAGPEHRRWRAAYNTRPALVLLRPLRPPAQEAAR